MHTLATKQFDDYVKRVRLFVHPRLAAELKPIGSFDALLSETLRQMG